MTAGSISVAVFGAAGYAGALAARLLHRHPHSSCGRSPRARTWAARLDDLYPHHRVPLVLEELDLDRHAEVDAAVVAYPHGAAARWWQSCTRATSGSSTCSADFRLRDAAVYEEWYREHPAPELLAEAVYGLPELYRERIRDADDRRQPGLLPHRRVLALAPLARAGLIDDVVIDAKSGRLGRRARRHRQDPLRHRRRERQPLRRAAPSAHPGDRAGAGGARVPTCGSRSRPTCCRSTRGSSSPAT